LPRGKNVFKFWQNIIYNIVKNRDAFICACVLWFL